MANFKGQIAIKMWRCGLLLNVVFLFFAGVAPLSGSTPGSALQTVQLVPNGGFPKTQWETISRGRGLGEIVIGTNADGRLELFALDAIAGSVWHTWQSTPNGDFGDWQIMGDARGAGRISVGRNADGRLELFALDAKAGSAWHTWQSAPNGNFGGWQIMGDSRGLGELAVGSNADGRLELFALDAKEGSAWHTWQSAPNGNFGGWQIMGDARGAGRISVGRNADGRLELFALDAKAGSAWHTWQSAPNGNFGGWQIMGDSRGLGELAVGNNAGGHLEVFALDAKEGSAWHTFQNGPNGPFGPWQIMGDSRGLGELAVGSNADGHLELFALDAKEGSAWHTWQNGPNGPFLGWQIMGDNRGLRRISVGRNADGLLNVVAINTDFYDALTHSVVSSKSAAYDLVTQTFDDNGIPLNPMLGAQTWSPDSLADPSLCDGGDPWKPPCTVQPIKIDNNVAKCYESEGALKGHANWGLATYEGQVYWENHSYYLQDDDYSFLIYRDDLAGMTKFDVDKGLYQGYLHSEFNSDQTINYFHTWYWDTLHQAVDADAGKGGVMGSWKGIHIPIPPYTKTRPIFDGKQAIVMGMYGLDCAHDCGAELHPVYAIAIHLKDDVNDDTWAIFVRNWGDEGYCSAGQERIQPEDQPFTFSFRFKRPGAVAVSLIPGDTSDPQGERTTAIDTGFASADTGWSAPVLVRSEGAVMTFFLSPSSQGNRINGMLHLKWTLDQQFKIASPNRKLSLKTDAAREERPEGQSTPILMKSTPAQRAALEKSVATPEHQSTSVRLTPRPAPPSRPVKPPRPPQVKIAPDGAREQRERQQQEILKNIAPPN